MQVNFDRSKRKIAILWFIYSFLIFAIVALQYFNGKFENVSDIAWKWTFNSLLPTLTLMIGTTLVDINTQDSNRMISKFYFRLPFLLSFFYLNLLILIIIIQPITGKPIISLMNESSIYLSPIQGLVTASLGIFFIKKER